MAGDFVRSRRYELLQGIFTTILIILGPYSPAILRFQMMFPPDYPILPPVINFISDIFHPLVTPLTTYTYTTGSTSSDTVSATDEERLPPGGFSLGHGFPQWFGRDSRKPFSPLGSSRHSSLDCLDPKTREGDVGQSAFAEGSNPVGASSEPASPAQTHMLAPLSSGLQAASPVAGVLDVLRYIKHTFSDESALDNLPLEAAGNAGAWKAWRAYRAGKGASLAPASSASERSQPDEWNWDGVWEQRVRRGIDSSISDSVLFGSVSSSSDSVSSAINCSRVVADCPITASFCKHGRRLHRCCPGTCGRLTV